MKKTKYTILEASKKAKMSRSNFYKNYINKGVISKTKEGNKVYIDASEFNRVFPKDTENTVKVDTTETDKDHKIQLLEQENFYLKQQNEELKKDKEYLGLLAIENKEIIKKKSLFEKLFRA